MGRRSINRGNGISLIIMKGKIWTEVDFKCFKDRVEIKEELASGERYSYRVKFRDTFYTLKGFKIELEHLKYDDKASAEKFKRSITKINEVFHEYFLAKTSSLLNPHEAKPLCLDYAVDVANSKDSRSYMYIEIIFDSNHSDKPVSFDLAYHPTHYLTLLRNFGVGELDTNSIKRGVMQEPFTYSEVSKDAVPTVTLKRMNLAGCGIDDDSIESTANIVKSTKIIEQLDLACNFIGNEGVRTISEALKVNATIKEVDLSSNKIEEEGARIISELLKVNKTIEKIDLSYNKVRSSCLSIIEILKDNTTLKELKLYKNEIGSEGMKAIGEVLKVNKTLELLDLGANSIASEEMAWLQKESKAKVIFY
eukprot:TRINITY_DN1558_c0_g2_i2.p1 TRINITY_DN1558_c0_g2~~TRINITY_DN1558_c0_g2_i2.p1  ORF type:complete len:365 (-),score=100.63 TRINITY_DN1558_c0_g2_i2:138-1232(-)